MKSDLAKKRLKIKYSSPEILAQAFDLTIKNKTGIDKSGTTSLVKENLCILDISTSFHFTEQDEHNLITKLKGQILTTVKLGRY